MQRVTEELRVKMSNLGYRYGGYENGIHFFHFGTIGDLKLIKFYSIAEIEDFVNTGDKKLQKDEILKEKTTQQLLKEILQKLDQLELNLAPKKDNFPTQPYTINSEGYDCHVCGMKFEAGKAYGYVCNHPECPTKVNVTC